MLDWNPEWERLLGISLGADLDDRATVQSVADHVLELNELFKHPGARGFRRYTESPAAQNGYATYYVLANMPKIVHILSTSNIRRDTIRHVADIGSGPGTMLLGILAGLSREDARPDRLHCVAVDRSSGMLRIARRVIPQFAGMLPIPVHLKTIKQDIARPWRIAGKFDLVVLSNVLCELMDDAAASGVVDTASARVDAGGYLVLIEPGTMTASRRLLHVRDHLLAGGWRLLAPCPGGYPCPALAAPADWCHHRLNWTPPEFLSAVDAVTGFHKSFLNFTYVVLIRAESGMTAPSDDPEGEFLVVSDVMTLKGRSQIHVCGGGCKRPAVLLHRHVNSGNQAFNELVRYDRIRLTNFTLRGGQIRISEETSVMPLKTKGKIG